MRRSVAVGRDGKDVEPVDLAEFLGFGFRRSGHARQLLVHAEVVLEGDRGERLVLLLDLQPFLGFDGLMESVAPPASGHQASGEFVDDDDFAVLDDIFTVALVQRVRAQALIDVVKDLHVGGIVEIVDAQQVFGAGDAFFRQRCRSMLFVDLIVDVAAELRNDLVDPVVLVGGLFAGTGDDQRCARFVDQDRVHFVDDREVVFALDAAREVELHVVAQVIEPKFVVGSVGDVGVIGLVAFLVVRGRAE